MKNQTTYDSSDEPCRCCGGTGTQYNALTGQREKCNCCNGTGKWNNPLIIWQKY